jgi:hypothetical protein
LKGTLFEYIALRKEEERFCLLLEREREREREREIMPTGLNIPPKE